MIVISCYFGTKLTGVYKAPMDSKCYFFSNNPKFKRAAKSKGWDFIFVEHMPLTYDYRISSLQSKYIKFLQFDKKKIGWIKGESILYFDHKLEVQLEHIQEAEKICKTEILIRNHPEEKLCIQDEIDEALGQKRYADVMVETVNWVERKIKFENYSSYNRIMTTGFILYTNLKPVQKLCDDVYNACVLLGQPECQIIWGVLAQKFEKNITRMDWKKLDIPWNTPKPSLVGRLYNLTIRLLRKLKFR